MCSLNSTCIECSNKLRHRNCHIRQLQSNPEALALSPAAQNERNTRSMRGWWGTTDRCHMAFDKYHSWKLPEITATVHLVKSDVGIRTLMSDTGSGFSPPDLDLDLAPETSSMIYYLLNNSLFNHPRDTTTPRYLYKVCIYGALCLQLF